MSIDTYMLLMAVILIAAISYSMGYIFGFADGIKRYVEKRTRRRQKTQRAEDKPVDRTA